MARPAANKYLTNQYILPEIWWSKLSHCAFLDTLKPDILARVQACDFDHTGPEITQRGLERRMTWDHIPEERTGKRGARLCEGKVSVLFSPFTIHWDGREIVRSHWAGDVETGGFAQRGRITDKLAQQIMLIVERYGRRPNWSGYSYRDEMMSNAILQCVGAVLRFDDTKGQNPFAYITTTVSNAFLTCLARHKKQENIRDEVLWAAGQAPSSGFETTGYTGTKPRKVA